MDDRNTGQAGGGRMAPGALLRRFCRDRKGVAAIEFAALAIPFFLMLFAILESCISFAAQQLMTNATLDVARQLRTGEIKPATLSEKELRDMLCARIRLLVADNCPGLEVDLRTYDTFEEAARVRIKFTPDGDLDTSDFKVEPGASLSKNMLRVFYRWPVMTDLLRKSMSNLPGGKTLLFSTTTWQNEPY